MFTTLLPEKDKKSVIREYHLRLTAVVLLFFSGATLLGLFLLIPSAILSRSREGIVEKKLAVLEATHNRLERGRPEEALKDSKELMRLFTTRAQYPNFSDTLDHISADRNLGIKVTAINATADAVPVVVLISGVAKSREVLSTYVKKLQSDRTFSSVTIPVSNFAKNKDIEFAISITKAQTN